jgi:hypothetical protein
VGFRPSTGAAAKHATLPDVTPAQHHDPVNDHAPNHADAQHTDGPNSKPGHAHSHVSTTGQTIDDHHARDHAARHKGGGADLLFPFKYIKRVAGDYVINSGVFADVDGTH